jgi:hypothetical protein
MTIDEPTREQIAALRARANRLFAEYQALVEETQPLAEARAKEMDGTLRRQDAAIDAEDRAWEALEAARADQRANPSDLALTAAVDQAEAAYADAQAHYVDEYRAIREIQYRLLDEQRAESDRVTQAGDRFRVAQDAAIEAEMQARDAFAQRVAHIDPTRPHPFQAAPSGADTCGVAGCDRLASAPIHRSIADRT